jgi:hypothetical protein
MPMPNAAWHERYPMPRNASLDQRVQWHIQHAKACGCREMPQTIVTELRLRRVRVSRRPRVLMTKGKRDG